jgi:hypothetical protein
MTTTTRSTSKTAHTVAYVAVTVLGFALIGWAMLIVVAAGAAFECLMKSEK